MANIFTLRCWVRAQPTHRVFDLNIPRAANVLTLQKMIKESESQEDTFRDVKAEDLRVYKPIPVAKPYNENLNNVALCGLGAPLIQPDLLSTLFESTPPTGYIHIIVDAPSAEVDCWLLGGMMPARDSFGVTVQTHKKIGELKRSIQENVPHLRNLDPMSIRLYRRSGSGRELPENCNKVDERDFLPANHLLYKAFLRVPVLEPYQVVVQTPEHAISESANQSAGPHGQGKITLARESYLAARPRKESPSSGSHPSSSREAQKNEKTRILCGRPRDAQDTIPATLLHPVFGQFDDDCRAKTKMTDQDNDFVDKLANVMSALYVDEKQRVEEVTKCFRLAAQLRFHTNCKVEGANYVTDAELSICHQNTRYSYVIAEVKNEAAVSTSEPYMQAAAYYVESTRAHASRMPGSPLPCLLLILTGSQLLFAGAVWNLRPIVQVLSAPVAFQYHCSDTRGQQNAARHMAAFRKAVASLKKYYVGLADEAKLSNTMPHDMLFPYCMSFKSLDDKSEQIFCYKEQPNKHKLVFFGELGLQKVPICIKFVRRYSRDAHIHCATLGFAPKLRGFKRLPGGWHMVVMDRLVDYDLLADLLETERPPKSLFESIGKQLKTLHKRNMVHGDVRDTNILVKKGDRRKFMIIDFDWAGKMGRVRYPPYVNHTGIKRPDGARDGKIIMAEHDDAMLRYLSVDSGI